jgi:radical SAM superfamily enzyme YgiQ (UPF0313 family)
MGRYGKIQRSIEMVSYLCGLDHHLIDEDNYLDYLQFDSEKQRKGMAETLGIDCYTLVYVANQIARRDPAARVILADGKRKSLPGIIEARRAKPCAVFITAISANFAAAVAAAFPLNFAKIPVVIGGIHVSTSPDDVALYLRNESPHPELISQVIGPADSNCVSEIIDDLNSGRLAARYEGRTMLENGLWGSDRVVVMDPHVLPNVSRIPLVGKKLGRKIRINSIAPFLGCPHRCNFCSISTLPLAQKSLAIRDPKDFVDELAYYQRTGVNTENRFFFFLPDNLLLGGNKLEEMLDLIIAGDIRINFAAQISIDIADRTSLLTKLRRAGATHFFIGLETLDMHNLEYIGKHFASDIKRKNLSVPEYYRWQLKKIQKAGISVHGSFIFGLPNDYFKDLNHHTGADIARFCIENRIGLQPTLFSDLPGSMNFRESQNNGSYLYGRQGSLEYLIGLCLADLTETNRVPFDSLKRSPLLLCYMAYYAIQRVGNAKTVVKNGLHALKNGFFYPTGNGTVSLKERLADSFWAVVSQMTVGQYKAHAEMIAYSNGSTKGSFERLLAMEEDRSVRRQLGDLATQFFNPA